MQHLILCSKPSQSIISQAPDGQFELERWILGFTGFIPRRTATPMSGTSSFKC
jgi:hypothetical protein